MSRKYIVVVVLGVLAMIGWNIFLIQRDERMFDSYYRSKATENLKKPPSAVIR